MYNFAVSHGVSDVYVWKCARIHAGTWCLVSPEVTSRARTAHFAKFCASSTLKITLLTAVSTEWRLHNRVSIFNASFIIIFDLLKPCNQYLFCRWSFIYGRSCQNVSQTSQLSLFDSVTHYFTCNLTTGISSWKYYLYGVSLPIEVQLVIHILYCAYGNLTIWWVNLTTNLFSLTTRSMQGMFGASVSELYLLDKLVINIEDSRSMCDHKKEIHMRTQGLWVRPCYNIQV